MFTCIGYAANRLAGTPLPAIVFGAGRYAVFGWLIYDVAMTGM